MTEAGDFERERESFKQGKTMGNKGWQALKRWLKKIKLVCPRKISSVNITNPPIPGFCRVLRLAPHLTSAY
jgi:hypothetical protein